MYTAFRLQVAVGILALDEDSCRLDPRLLAGMMVNELDLESVALAPAGVHTLQHFGPILALGAARSSVDLDIGIIRVSFTGKQGGHLVAFRPLRKVGETPDGIVNERLVALAFG